MTDMAMEVTNKYLHALNKIAAESATLSLNSDAVRVCMLLSLEEYACSMKEQAKRCEESDRIDGLESDNDRYRSMVNELASWLAGFESEAFKTYGPMGAVTVAIRVLEHYRHENYRLTTLLQERDDIIKGMSLCIPDDEPSAPAASTDEASTLTIDIPRIDGIFEVIASLGQGQASWAQLDRSTRKAVAARVIRGMITNGGLTSATFETGRPAFLPSSGAIISMFGCRWSELIEFLARQPLSIH